MRTKGLTPKQELFCQVYVSTGNATEAYRQAYDTSNMQYRVIMVKACELLHSGKISVRVKELEAERNKRLDSVAIQNDVVKTCVSILHAKVTDLYDVDEVTGKSRLKNFNALPKDLQVAIKKVSSKRGDMYIELSDKLAAADRLAKIFGFDAPEKSEVSINGGEIDVQIKQ